MNSADRALPAPAGLLSRACASTRSVLASVTREQLDLPTPCAEWQVRDLIDHIVGATDFFADVAELGDVPDDREWPGHADGDFVASFDQQARRCLAAFCAAGAMERVMMLPTGPAPWADCIAVATGEIFAHGWDLARATGQAVPDQGVAAALLASPWMALCDQVRNGEPAVIAARIGVPGDAPAMDRLAAFLGRDPAWPAGR